MPRRGNLAFLFFSTYAKLFLKVPVPGMKAKVKHHIPVPGMKAKVKYHIPVPGMKFKEEDITATEEYNAGGS